MYNDGANEIHYFQNEENASPTSGMYSYLKGDKYIIVCPGPEGFWYYSSDKQQNGKRIGKSFTASGNNAPQKGFNICEFEGDAGNFVSNVLIDKELGVAERYTAQSAYSIINGVICPYFDNELDIKAFENIDAVYYDKKGPQWYIVRGLKLAGGAIIDLTDESGRLSFQEAEEFREDELTGHWDFFPTDSYNIKLWLDLSGGTSTLSGCFPAPLSQLRLANGFEELYATLKSQSTGYFDNYYVTEFLPIANIKANVANIQNIINATINYVLSNYDEF